MSQYATQNNLFGMISSTNQKTINYMQYTKSSDICQNGIL